MCAGCWVAEVRVGSPLMYCHSCCNSGPFQVRVRYDADLLGLLCCQCATQKNLYLSSSWFLITINTQKSYSTPSACHPRWE